MSPPPPLASNNKNKKAGVHLFLKPLIRNCTLPGMLLVSSSHSDATECMSAMLFKLATESVQVSNGKRALAPVQNDRFLRERKLRDCLARWTYYRFVPLPNILLKSFPGHYAYKFCTFAGYSPWKFSPDIMYYIHCLPLPDILLGSFPGYYVD